MEAASEAQEFETAAAFRNKLKAVRSLLERQRVSNEAVGTVDAIAVAAEDTDANAQVFQIRDGVLADRQSFYLENEAGRDEPEVVEEFVLQYYASSPAIPPQVLVPHGLDPERSATLGEALAARRGAPVEIRTPERGDKRRIFELAERNARLALDQDRLRNERRRTNRIDALEGPAARRSACRPSRCASSASTSRTWARPTPWPRWWCSRGARRRSPTTAASASARPRRTTSPP